MRKRLELGHTPIVHKNMDNHDQSDNKTHMEESGSRLNQTAYVVSGGMAAVLSRKHHFVVAIMAVSLSVGWNGPTINKYDGSSDPNEHIDAYVSRIFPTSLKGTTLSWFTRLPPLSIDCFDTLMVKFSTQLTTSKPHHHTSLTLVNIRQERAETLRSFMD